MESVEPILLKKVHSDHVINLLSDFEYYEGSKRHHIFIFPLLERNLLQQLLRKGKTPEEVLRIAHDVCSGLRDLHSKGIIHQDLKPENIVFDKKNDRFVLIDLGSATLLLNKAKKKYHYIQSSFYRAPEICLRRDYDFRVDVWSLGCIMVELLT